MLRIAKLMILFITFHTPTFIYIINMNYINIGAVILMQPINIYIYNVYLYFQIEILYIPHINLMPNYVFNVLISQIQLFRNLLTLN